MNRALAALPSVDRLLREAAVGALIERYGRAAVTGAIRSVLAELRAARDASDEHEILQRITKTLADAARPSLRPVFNLTGTVLHTNLGRAQLPEAAIEAMADAAREPVNLEYDLEAGKRGERDAHVEALLCRLTGAEAATVVNNNAAAVLLVLSTLAARKEVPVSRGELIEIGGAFRLPDIMARSGCRLREVGTTNRTHLSDYAEAIGAGTGLVLKAHTSNYVIQGFTASVAEDELASLCRSRGVPLAVDLGSGTLVDLARFGLPREPTVGETLRHGADLVTFSGDKLLGGPQAGFVVGNRSLVEKLRKNPLKRALRVDKLRLAAIGAVLGLHLDPDRLREQLPTLRFLTRSLEDIRQQARRLAAALERHFEVEVIDCESEIGSGAAPGARIASAGLALKPGSAATAARFRNLPVPVIGRLQDGVFILDLRCLEDEARFSAQLERL
jgi:L-seryl-tRNA(Ser) seleniumtransferase